MKFTTEMEWLQKFGNETADKILEHLANYAILLDDVANYAKTFNITSERLLREQRLASFDTDTAIERLEEYIKSTGADIYAKDRRQVNVLPRYCFFYTLRRYTNMSLTEIADQFGCDHSTVIHGERKISYLVGKDSKVTKMVNAMTSIVFDEAEVEMDTESEPVTGWVTIHFAAQHLGISSATIRNWAKQNRIRAMKQKGPMRVRLEQVEHYAATKADTQYDYRGNTSQRTRNTPRRAAKVGY